MTDFMLDEWLKPDYAPQKTSNIMLISNLGEVIVGYLTYVRNRSEYPRLWYVVRVNPLRRLGSDLNDYRSIFFVDDDIKAANINTGTIVLK
jgi:hypothetical protein